MLKFLELFGFVYGGEFIAALEEAEAINADLVYGDRDIKETMKRFNESWSITTSWKDMWDEWSGNLQNQWKLLSNEQNSQQQQQQSKSNWYSKSSDGLTESFGKRDDDGWGSWFGGGSSDNQSHSSGNSRENLSFWEEFKQRWEESKRENEKMKAKIPQTNWKEIWNFFTNPEKAIEEMKDRNKIREKLGEFRKLAPELVKALVDERDQIMTENLKKCKGKRIVAVVGIGHMDGMEEFFRTL